MRPIICFEGPDGAGKSKLTRLTAERIGAAIFRNPPHEFKDARPIFDNIDVSDEDALKRRFGFYMAGNMYVAARAAEAAQRSLIVVDRHVYSTVASHSALMGVDLDLPSWIRVPDHIVHVTAPLDTLDKRISERESEKPRNQYETREILEATMGHFDRVFDGMDNVLRLETRGTKFENLIEYVVQELRL